MSRMPHRWWLTNAKLQQKLQCFGAINGQQIFFSFHYFHLPQDDCDVAIAINVPFLDGRRRWNNCGWKLKQGFSVLLRISISTFQQSKQSNVGQGGKHENKMKSQTIKNKIQNEYVRPTHDAIKSGGGKMFLQRED